MSTEDGTIKGMTLKNLAVSLFSIALPMMSIAAPAERLFYPEAKADLNFKTQPDIEKALPAIIKAFGLKIDASQLKLSGAKESLLGKHYYFDQILNNRLVQEAQLVISTNLQTGGIVKVYNNTKAVPTTKLKSASLPMISQEMALDIAWKEINGSGALVEAPSVSLIYSQDLVLVYDIKLSTKAPFGYWSLKVNAMNGSVIEAVDGALPRMKRAPQAANKSKKISTVSYSEAFNAFEQNVQKKALSLDGILVKGSAQIFNPNPVVTLARTDLQDDSAATEFTQAYTTEDLLDITFSGGVYSLKGPKVTIVDFESPTMAPSTTPDGIWGFERKNLKFNDAMTYFHIDKSVRYLENLGFKQKKVIFPKSIEVDANGVDGEDNSHYIPSSRRLAFGHGCVDDNEDSDVILHELGHAIQHHINSSWSGGDTGAMGEGFGDYWASSYSASLPGGLDTNPNWVFKWDGHNDCWGGRKLNATSMKYDPKKVYGAHSRVGVSDVSDELWSTPLFQAFLEFQQKGVTRADVDKIIIEAHFGLGSGLKMPEMAKAIIKTAKALFPAKDYDQVFERHFKTVNIISK
jgi:hypothetical protein